MFPFSSAITRHRSDSKLFIFAAAVTLPIDKRGRYQMRRVPGASIRQCAFRPPSETLWLSNFSICGSASRSDKTLAAAAHLHLKACGLFLTLRSQARCCANSGRIYCTYRKKKFHCGQRGCFTRPFLSQRPLREASVFLGFFFCRRITRQH